MITLLLLACAGSEGVAGPHEVVAVRWASGWTVDDIARAAEGWQVVTDTGAVVTVTEGYLALGGFSLVPCEAVAARARPGLFGAVAFADHATDADASALPNGYATRVDALESVVLDRLAFSAASYCGVHVVVSPADGETAGLPATPSLEDTTVWLAADVTLPGGGSRRLRLSSGAADGRVLDLVMPEQTGAVALTVGVGWQAASLFDGIDFASDDDAVVAWRVLENLVGDVDLDVAID